MLNDPLTPEEIEERWNCLKKKNLRVFYGVSKINKILKKRALTVMFENDTCGLPEDNERKASRWMFIVYTRYQTLEEKEDAIYRHKMFTTYQSFIDEKPWKGNWNAVLHNNYLADQNHVNEKERLIIKEKLGKAFRKYYDLEVPYQSSLEF
ncbi:Uncharacterised protein [Chryseobacterium nakagawai]|uniref:Uncharacterized protein n=1 Tax=Chryseobacterium nakagawai TaxID=1241982 RepID=A0AAD0YLD3_CHRNA|nr:hypothetical protein [Chryseobacterium nakagawai]AZA90942.1 hypothetical protein EG343_09985 [Chryseobacterium nakagawai]VEH22480.1 Uncharacterised protein [Chryseobacterium nakagawai]